MKNESMRKSLEKLKKVLEEKRKNIQAQKICIKKTNTFTIIDMNFVQEQLKTTGQVLNCNPEFIFID